MTGSNRNSPCALRAGEARDLSELASIEREAFSQPWEEAALRPWLDPGRGLVLVASVEGGGESAGYALFLLAPGEAELLRIAVRPCHRRTGLGRALLAQGLERLASDGRPVVTLEVRADNKAARVLYESLSFAVVGVRRGYYADGCDAVVYRRQAGAVD